MADKEQEHSTQLKEYAQLLDIRAARIKKLESQLKDIAYGTRQVKVDTKRFEYEGDELGESIELERGQNLLQFHVSQVMGVCVKKSVVICPPLTTVLVSICLQVVLSSETVSHLHTASPALFVTFNFSDYETQVTSVKQGTRSVYSREVHPT